MLSLVMFKATWCKPCAAMQPVMDSIPEIYGDKVFITNSDIDSNPQMRVEHHVRSIPTFLLFKDGFEVSRKIGSCTSSEMREWINEFLGDLQPDVL